LAAGVAACDGSAVVAPMAADHTIRLLMAVGGSPLFLALHTAIEDVMFWPLQEWSSVG